jgi:hypothetical protein
MGFSIGLFIGVFTMFWLHSYAMNSFKRILVMKAKNGTAEHINGKFYYIKEEGK